MVMFKYHENPFSFQEGDNVQAIVRSDLYCKEGETPLSYFGKVTEIEEEGFWMVLPENEEREEFLAFIDLEGVEAANNHLPDPNESIRKYKDSIKNLNDTISAVQEELKQFDIEMSKLESKQERETMEYITMTPLISMVKPGMKVKVVSAQYRPNETNIQNGEIYIVSEVIRGDKGHYRYITSEGKDIRADVTNVLIEVDKQREHIVAELKYWMSDEAEKENNESIIEGAIEALDRLLYRMELERVGALE